MSILIVDDDLRVAQSLQGILTLEKHESHIVTSGAAAMEELAGRPYDIVLLDLNMPRIDGITVLEHINRYHQQISVIVVSGESEIKKAIQVLKCGAKDFIRKPYTPEELLFSINNVLEKIQLERDNREMIKTLQESEALHKFIVHNSPDLLYMLDQNGNFSFINKNTINRLGYSRKELIGKHYTKVVYHEDIDQAKEYFEVEPNQRLNERLELRLQCKQPDEIIYVEVRSINIERKLAGGYKLGRSSRSGVNFIGTYGVARDITEKKRSEEIIRHQHNHDPLTGLPNRALFLERLNQLINRAAGTGETFAIILIDINRFKLINDTYSQVVGDKILRRFVDRLQQCCSPVDTLARIGGDEFILLLSDENAHEKAIARSEKIVAETSLPFRHQDQDIHISVSIGIATYPEHGSSSEDLIKNVDTALCNLKVRSTNSYCLYNQTLKNKNSQKVFTENLIRTALKKDQLVVFYQPQINLKQKKIHGIEALARIQTGGKLIYPAHFIHVAEETTLVTDIGTRVIEKSFQDLKSWNRQGIKLQLSINVSAVQLQMESFTAGILERIHHYDLDPRDIEIELTENVLVQDLNATIANIVKLTDYGIKIAVDDFGTGYSSLSYLDRLPLHTLKLDKSFVRKITDDNPIDTIIPAMIRVAEGLKLRFIVEGIETRRQHEYLLQHGADIGQGYFYSQPLSKEQLTERLRKKNS